MSWFQNIIFAMSASGAIIGYYQYFDYEKYLRIASTVMIALYFLFSTSKKGSFLMKLFFHQAFVCYIVAVALLLNLKFEDISHYFYVFFASCCIVFMYIFYILAFLYSIIYNKKNWNKYPSKKKYYFFYLFVFGLFIFLIHNFFQMIHG